MTARGELLAAADELEQTGALSAAPLPPSVLDVAGPLLGIADVDQVVAALRAAAEGHPADVQPAEEGQVRGQGVCALCAPHPRHKDRCQHVWPDTNGLTCACRKSPAAPPEPPADDAPRAGTETRPWRPSDPCPVCGAQNDDVYGVQLCATVTGRDHKARWAGPLSQRHKAPVPVPLPPEPPAVCSDCGRALTESDEERTSGLCLRCLNGPQPPAEAQQEDEQGAQMTDEHRRLARAAVAALQGGAHGPVSQAIADAEQRGYDAATLAFRPSADMETLRGRRLAVDADGYVWWVNADDTWSMVWTNQDNTPIPQPVTYYEPARPSADTEKLFERVRRLIVDHGIRDDANGELFADRLDDVLRAALDGEKR